MTICSLLELLKETAKEVPQRSIVNGVRKEFDPVLVAPAIVDDRLAVELTQVNVGVVYVHGICDALALRRGQPGIGDDLVLSRGFRYGIQRTALPVNQVPRTNDV